MRRALSIPLVVAALPLAFAAPAFAGKSGPTVSLGGLSTGSGSTPAGHPSSDALVIGVVVAVALVAAATAVVVAVRRARRRAS